MASFRQLIHEIHRRSLWQVLGVYAVASWVVYQIVVALYEGIGLPSWVPGTALVLLLIGLPVVLATAFVQEGAPGLGGDPGDEPIEGLETTADTVAADRPTANVAGAPKPEASDEPGSRRDPSKSKSKSLFTWNKAITAGILAFAALGLAAAGFMGMRALGIGPAATLISSGELEARAPILLADFTSASGDSVMADAVTEALRVDLEESPAVSVLQPSHVAETLRRMQRDHRAPLTPALAREIALRDGITAWLEGDVTAVGATYALTARLVSTATDEPLVSVRETGTADEILAATDRLSRALRERIGESFRSIRASEPLATVTTPSLEALRKYSQGVHAYATEPTPDKAIALLEEAVAMDTAFAMAWRKLGVAYDVRNADETAREAFRKAYAHRDRLTDRERYITLGTYYSIIEEDPERTITAYETLLDQHPDDHTALHNLAREYSIRGDTARAIELYRRAIEVQPYTAGTYRNLAHVLGDHADYQGATEVIRPYRERFPEHPQAHSMMAHVHASRGAYDSAATHVDQFAEVAEGTPGLEQQALFMRADLAAVRGRLTEAMRWWTEADPDRGEPPPGMPADDPRMRDLFRAYEAARIDYEFRHDLDAAWDRLGPAMAAANAEAFIESMPAAERPYIELAWVYAQYAGDADKARHYLGELERTRTAEDLDEMANDLRQLRAYIALAAGQYDRAIELLREVWTEWTCVLCRHSELAWAFDRAGRADSAIARYETYLAAGDLNRLPQDTRWRAWAHERLGALYEARGETAPAARHYGRFVELWADADPDLQPRVEAGRRALERLAGEGGS